MDTDLELEDSLNEGTQKPKKPSPIRPLIRSIQRRWWIVAGTTSLSAAAAIALSSSDPPTYSGSFRMLVEPVTSEARIAEPSALTRTEGVPSRDVFSLDYPTQLEILQSPRVLQDVYERVQAKYPGFVYPQLVRGLMVGRLGTEGGSNQTKILEVAFQGSDPGLVQLVLEELARKYLSYSLEDRKTRIGEGVKFIEDQLPPLQNRVNNLQSQLQQLQQQYDLIDPNAQGGQIFQQLRTVAEQQDAVLRELMEQQTLYVNLQRQLQLSPQEAIAASALSQNPRYQQILNGINELDSQIALESARFSEASPIIERLRQRQTNLKQLRDRQVQQILGQTLGNVQADPQALVFQDSVRVGLIQQMLNTGNTLQMLQVRYQSIAQSRATIEREAQKFPVIVRRYTELQRQLGIATRTLDQLLSQRETLRVEAAQNQVPWELLSPPGVPMDAAGNPLADPVSSRRKVMMGLAAGWVMGLAAVLLLERWKNIFYTEKDIADLFPAPILGKIPACGKDSAYELSVVESAAELVRTTAGVDLDEGITQAIAFYDAFSVLYTGLCFLPGGPIRSLVVSSATVGDGKTTVALHLAQTAASMGRGVLLVDANLRDPRLHTKLGLNNQRGLIDLLGHRLPLSDAIQSLPQMEHLSVLTTGMIQPGCSRLLASPQMKQLMEEFDANFDLVIYDTPALDGIVDATFVASNSDGLLMVARTKHTPRSKAAQVLKQIEEFNLPILAVVANGLQAKGMSMPDKEDDDFYDEEDEEETSNPEASLTANGGTETDSRPSGENHHDNAACG